MSTGLLEIVKQAAINVIENKQMCDLRYGEVVSVSPLKIKLTPQLTIPSSVIVVPRQLTSYEVQLNGSTIIVDNSLRIGDKVALLRKQGGQSYFVLDKISESIQSVSASISPTVETYDGSYTIVPSVESQVMETEGKYMKSDVTVTEIPYSEVSNDSNGTTVTIG